MHYRRLVTEQPARPLQSHYLYRIPNEIILQILGYLRIGDRIRFILANYCILQSKRLVHAMTWAAMRRLQATIELDSNAMVYGYMAGYNS